MQNQLLHCSNSPTWHLEIPHLRVPRALIKTCFNVGLAFVACLCLPNMVLAQSSTWTTPQMLGAGWFPDIATDSTGMVYVAWASGDSDYDLVMYTSDSDQGWRIPNDVQALEAPAGRYATRPSLLIDPHGLLHLGFRGATIWYSHVPLQDAYDAQAWSEPLSVAPAGYFSKIVYGNNGVIFFFFSENEVRSDCTNCFHLMVQKSTDGESWSSPLDITPTLNGTAKPQIVIDVFNNIYVVFEAGYGGDLGQLADPSTVMFVASYNDGNTWTYPLRLTPQRGDTPNAQARNIAIALDKNQNLIVVWWAIPEDVIYYQTSTDQGRTWSAANAIPGVAGHWSVIQSRLDDYTMATDSAGHIHLVMTGRLSPADADIRLMHLEWDGSNWSRPDTIITYQDDVPEWPRLVIGNGNQLHVAWFVRDGANLYSSDTSNYQVWYARGQSAAPYINPVALAIPTPTPNNIVNPMEPEPLPLTAATVALDAQLKLPDNSSVNLNSLTTENDDVMLLAMSLLPAIFVTGVIAFFIRRRRYN